MGEIRKVVLASRNPDKVRELQQLFQGLPFEVVAASDYPDLPEVIEDGTTIEGNAARKALLTAAYTGEIALADDTSLQVRELNAWPDIFAARFSGPGATYRSNADLVLELMKDVPDGSRQARFASACAWVDPRPETDDCRVNAPAQQRWLRNPWARAIEIQDPTEEWAFWNQYFDRPNEWRTYRRAMLADLAAWGHDRARLHEVAVRLLAECGEAPATTTAAEVRVPDPMIWAVTGPETDEEPLTVVAPSGLDREAPGRDLHGPFWRELSATGKLLGSITRQPLGGGGFGYDPVFLPDGEQRTLAELAVDDKNRISHRGRALRRLMRAVREAYGR